MRSDPGVGRLTGQKGGFSNKLSIADKGCDLEMRQIEINGYQTSLPRALWNLCHGLPALRVMGAAFPNY